MVFKTLNIRQWRTMILKKWEINNIGPIITPAYCFKEFLDHVTGNAGRAQDASWLRKLSGEIGRPEFTGERIGKEKARKREIQRLTDGLPQLFNRVLISTFVWQNLGRPKNHLKDFTKSGNRAILTSQTRKAPNLWDTVEIIQKSYAWVVGNNKP